MNVYPTARWCLRLTAAIHGRNLLTAEVLERRQVEPFASTCFADVLAMIMRTSFALLKGIR